KPLLSDILEKSGIVSKHPCGGRGVCGKCAVNITGNLSNATDSEKKFGKRLSCQTRLFGDCTVDLSKDENDSAVIETEGINIGKHTSPTEKTGYGISADIGTTTVVVGLFDMKTGEQLSSASELNPQISIAADVMGRIKASLEGKRDILKELIVTSIEKLTSECLSKAGLDIVPEYYSITGNTTMLYALTGKDPVSLSAAPFEADCLFGNYYEINGHSCYLPPCISAFVGADITCAVEASGMTEKGETALLCDIGTNGEIALFKDGKLYVTSTAAGPAFEGAGISCGCGAVNGAIDTVKYENGEIKYTTIGNAPPVGVCGSGIIDAVAAFLEAEYVDETGMLDSDGLISDEIGFIPQDIRSVQLAKAAISAGIETLITAAGCNLESVKTFYIAGGFGKHLNVDSAVKIGLFPAALRDKVKVIGNAAFSGATSALLYEETKLKLQNIVGISKAINLGGNKQFNELYVENMFFDTEI
ncbi:MAG: DUF4445 domain-containing protein, partial [Clostridia bacterium]|nr:DUF4445 domain-containing protein [Clostridia bacterium]